MKMKQRFANLFALLTTVTILFGAARASAQTSSFTYQGRLTDGGTAANGNYDLQFGLWDSLGSGAPIGAPLTFNTVAVSNGVFTVTLDFGANSFSGANRFLEISARPSGAGSFTLLVPRQQVTATPYAIRSVSSSSADTAAAATNATQLGGVAASQYVQTNDSRLADLRLPAAGSTNYIQNSGSQQTTSNFNVSGNGTAGGTLSGNIINTGSQFNINGIRVLSEPGGSCGSNLFAGDFAGQTNTTGCLNSFFGLQAGNKNNGDGNSFFGSAAGVANDSGDQNSFFGFSAGRANSTGSNNAFFGVGTGQHSNGNNNTFVGASADFNVNNATGDNNTLIGTQAKANAGLSNATAIGSSAQATQSNSIVLGSISGVNSATDDTNVGIGTTTPRGGLEVKRNWDGSFGALTVTGDRPTIRFSGGSIANNDQWILHLGSAAGTAPAGSLSFFFGGSAGTSFGSPILSVTPGGTVMVSTLGSAGGTQLCRNASSEISTCSSSLRYKTRVLPFVSGLDIINRLRPITFEWKEDHMKDIGLGAEEVERVEPLLTFRNARGEIEGVKYNQLSAVFINAFKDEEARIQKQETLIEEQQRQIKQQQVQFEAEQKQFDTLKNLVCRTHQRAAACK